MKFNAKKAEHEYITDNSMSYRKLAEKYEVNYTTVQVYGRKHNWVDKRKEYQSKLAQKTLEKTVEKQSDKLSKLSSATDKAIDYVERCFEGYADENNNISIGILKDIATTLKYLTGVQRNLNGILTVQEENALQLAREKLQIERERIGVDEGNDGETGIVFIPALAPEETENVVIEGETDV